MDIRYLVLLRLQEVLKMYGKQLNNQNLRDPLKRNALGNCEFMSGRISGQWALSRNH